MGSTRTGRRGIAASRASRALVRVVVGALTLALAVAVPAAPSQAALLYPGAGSVSLGSDAFPMGMAADPAHHRVFVADYGNDEIQVIDTSTKTVTATIPSNGPRDVAYDAVHDIVYVAEYDGDSIKKYDGSTFAFIAGYRAGRQPVSIDVDPGLGKVYVGVLWGMIGVSVVDASFPGDVAPTLIPLADAPRGLQVDPSDHSVYVSTSYGLSVIDGRTDTEVSRMELPSGANDVAIDMETHRVYVPSVNAGVVSTIDGPTRTLVDTTAVTGQPWAAAVDSVTHTVYAASDYTVTVIDPVTLAVRTTAIIGEGPRGAAVDTSTHELYVASALSTRVDIVGEQDEPPAVVVAKAPGQAGSTQASPIQFTATFNDDVTGFTAADVSFAGSTVSGTLAATVAGGPRSYTITVTGMTGDGSVVVSVPAGAAVDAQGRGNTASNGDATVVYDFQSPSVTLDLATGQSALASTSPIHLLVTFSDPVQPITGSDISFAGSTAGGTLQAVVLPLSSNQVFHVDVSGMTTAGTVVVSVPAGATTDLAGNPSLASSESITVTWDTTVPTATITQSASTPDPTSGAVFFDVVFSVPITGFDYQDMTFTGSTAGSSLYASPSATSPDKMHFRAWVLGVTTAGTIVAHLPAGTVTSLTGVPNAAAVELDNQVTWTPQTIVTVEQAAGQADPAHGDSVSFTVSMSAVPRGLDASDFSFAGSTVGGTLVPALTGSGTEYTLTVSGMTTAGIVTASLPASVTTNAGGYGNLASTSVDNTVSWSPAAPPDVVSPGVSVEQAVGQADPTSVSPVGFTVEFSEPVTGFDVSDVSLVGSTASGPLTASVTGGPSAYVVTVSGMSSSGSVVVSVPAGAASDAAGNSSLASTSVDNTVSWTAPAPTDPPTDPPTDGGGSGGGGSPDVVAPGVSVEQAVGQADPTSLSPVGFTVEFSEPVTGFDASDVSLAGSTAGGPLTASVTGGPSAYVVTVSGMSSSGSVVVSVPAGAASDAAGNSSLASTSVDNTVSWTAPAPTDPPTGGGSGSGTGTGGGSGTTGTVDVVAPTVTVEQSAGQADPASSGPVTFAVTFSEPVTGLTASDVSLAGSTAGGTLVPALSGSGPLYTLTVTGMTTPGVVTVSVPAGAATDVAGNPSAASTSVDNAVEWDATAPTIRCVASPRFVIARGGHRLVPVRVGMRVGDAGSGVAGVVLRAVTSSQADGGLGRGDTPGDMVGWDVGSNDGVGFVRAEAFRSDRVYSLTYEVTDRAGNSALCTTTVTVKRR